MFRKMKGFVFYFVLLTIHFKKYFCRIKTYIVILRSMGLTKTEEFTVKQNKIARYMKALSHPARVAILELLIKKQACICGDIVDELPLSQSTVSQHLKELKAAGLIKGDIEGVKVCYCIDGKEWENAKNYLDAFFSNYKNDSRCC